MHIITNVVAAGRKIKLEIDECEIVQLYKGEVRKLGLELNHEFSEDTYIQIYEILKRRAKERCLLLLKDMDKTEKQLRDKLREGDYPQEIIDDTIEFLEKYNYVNDERYAELYLNLKKNKKSVRELQLDLIKRGVSKSIINKVLERNEFSDDAILREILEKKIRNCNLSDRNQINKVYRYLLGKGFKYEQITKEFSKYVEIQ